MKKYAIPVTAAERQFAIDRFKCAPDAPDEIIRTTCVKAVEAGTLEWDEWFETIKVKMEPGTFGALYHDIRADFDNARDEVLAELEAIALDATKSKEARRLQILNFRKTIDISAAATKTAREVNYKMPDTVTKNAEMPNHKNGSVHVKKASEQYRHVKSAATHVRTGEVMTTDRGRQTETSSERDYAKLGTLFKYFCHRRGIGSSLNEHENDLLNEIFNEDTFSGAPTGEKSYEIGVPGLRAKQLLNDTLSGGFYLTPEWFDEQVITYPKLYGELFPFVTVRDVPRGAVVETASIDNPDVSWGTSEGTQMPIFDTDDLINEIEKSIFAVTCTVVIGRDALNDSVVNLGQILESNIGQTFTAEFDKVIAIGNGTSQPEGIFTASGITSVNNAGGAGTAATLADYENLYFGIGKQYRTPDKRCAFIANDVSYKRLRSIPVDASTDQRRLLGMNYADYSMMGAPFKIQNDISNAKRAFGALSTYRLWRRQATEVLRIDGDYDLARANTFAMIFRARMGGGIVDPNAWIKTTDGQA